MNWSQSKKKKKHLNINRQNNERCQEAKAKSTIKELKKLCKIIIIIIGKAEWLSM